MRVKPRPRRVSVNSLWVRRRISMRVKPRPQRVSVSKNRVGRLQKENEIKTVLSYETAGCKIP